LRTGPKGHAELQLNPNTYVRLGEHSLLRLLNNNLRKPKLTMVKGSALMEVLQDTMNQQISMTSRKAWMLEQQKGSDAAAAQNAEDARSGSVRYNDSRITTPAQ
jgi:hypothetical protein